MCGAYSFSDLVLNIHLLCWDIQCNKLSLFFRTWDLEKQLKQLNHYKQTNGMIDKWIQETRQRQDALQITKFSSVEKLMDHLNQQKVSQDIMSCLFRFMSYRIWEVLVKI